MKTILRILALLALSASAFAADIPVAAKQGQTITLVGSSEGSPPISYEWSKDGTPVAVVQNLVIANLQPSHAGIYTLRAFNKPPLDDGGSTMSEDRVLLTVTAPSIPPSPPKITVGLANVTVNKGDSETLRVAVTGNPTPSLQWRHGVSNIRGATQDFLTISSAKPKDGGTYAVRATNAHGWAESGAVVTIANR
jgi:hypothetical protein